MLARLDPAGERPPHEWLEEVRPRERAPGDRPFVYLNMVTSADGRAAIEGRSHALGLRHRHPAADRAAHARRRRADRDGHAAGGGLRADRRQRRTAWRAARPPGSPPTPTAVLLSRSLDLPWDAGLFAAAGQPVLAYTGSDAEPPDVAAALEVVRLEDPSPAAALADLRARGVRALLCEGGPTLNRALLGRRGRRRALPHALPAARRECGRAADRGRRGPARIPPRCSSPGCCATATSSTSATACDRPPRRRPRARRRLAGDAGRPAGPRRGRSGRPAARPARRGRRARRRRARARRRRGARARGQRRPALLRLRHRRRAARRARARTG